MTTRGWVCSGSREPAGPSPLSRGSVLAPCSQAPDRVCRDGRLPVQFKLRRHGCACSLFTAAFCGGKDTRLVFFRKACLVRSGGARRCRERLCAFQGLVTPRLLILGNFTGPSESKRSNGALHSPTRSASG